MSIAGRSKREHCPACDSIRVFNYVLVRPGEDMAVFVECADCGAFVARYTLKEYTCDDPYRSYLRMMRGRDMASGADARKKGESFADELWSGYREAKETSLAKEETIDVEDLLGGV